MPDNKPIKLGELLIVAGLLKPEALAEAIRTASETSLPIGRVLIMAGSISEIALQAAIQAQSMLKDKRLEQSAAVAALKVIGVKNIPLEDALKQLQIEEKREVKTAKLGDLLITAELVSDDQLSEALRSSQETGLPLGRILVLTQAISEELLSAALTAQVLVRDEKITKEQAIEGLRSARRRRVSIEESLADHGYFRPPLKQNVKLGELFVLAELILESDLMTALEKGLVQQLPVGQILLQAKLSTQETLDTALSLQEMVANGTLNSLQAGKALRQVALQRYSLTQALAEISTHQNEPEDPFRLGDILKAAGIINEDDIQRAVEMSVKNSMLFGRILNAAGLVDDQLLNSALRAQFLIREGFLGLEQAIIALSQCRQTGQSFDEVIQQLGWTFQTRSKVES